MLRASVIAVGLGSAVVVGIDGTPLWQAVRAVAAGSIALLLHVAATRATRASVGGATFAVGVVALSIGVAIGVPHLVKGGGLPLTVAGLVTLAGGLVLSTSGAVTLVGMTPRWLRVVSAPSLAVAAIVVLYTLGQAVAFTNVPRTEIGHVTPADRGLAYRDVEFPSTDGVRLSGWYVPSTNGAAVVLLHGAGSTRSNVLDHAVLLSHHGYGVLLFDARGHGRSGGRAMDAGWWGDQDLAGAISFVLDQPDVDPARIAAIGMSMGGEEALGAAAADPRIRAVVAEGSGQRVAADKRWQSEEFGARGWLQEQVDWLEFALTDLLTSADPPISLRSAVAAMAPRRALLITAGDVGQEQTVNQYIRAASPSTVEVWMVPGAAHTGGLATAPEEWERLVVGFLASALDAPESPAG